jgi:hypothetical protein
VSLGEPTQWNATPTDLDDDGDTELVAWDHDASVGGCTSTGALQVAELP